MKKSFRSVFAGILLIVVLTGLFSSCSLTGNKATEYKENTDGYGLYRHSSTYTETAFTVPGTYEGKNVTELMGFSFANAD